jgi:hypothetical protein
VPAGQDGEVDFIVPQQLKMGYIDIILCRSDGQDFPLDGSDYHFGDSIAEPTTQARALYGALILIIQERKGPCSGYCSDYWSRSTCIEQSIFRYTAVFIATYKPIQVNRSYVARSAKPLCVGSIPTRASKIFSRT